MCTTKFMCSRGPDECWKSRPTPVTSNLRDTPLYRVKQGADGLTEKLDAGPSSKGWPTRFPQSRPGCNTPPPAGPRGVRIGPPATEGIVAMTLAKRIGWRVEKNERGRGTERRVMVSPRSGTGTTPLLPAGWRLQAQRQRHPRRGVKSPNNPKKACRYAPKSGNNTRST